jgi:TatD DNase family protein
LGYNSRMLIDTHCHLTFKDFRGQVEEVLKRAEKCGVRQLVAVGVDLEDSLKNLELAQKYENVFATLGVHPSDASKWEDRALQVFLEKIREGWDKREKNVVAIGEIGLDYYHMKAPREVQKEVFRKQLQFARKVQLPVVVHSRDAFEDVFEILEEEMMESVVFHCFAEGRKEAEKIWANEWHTSFTGTVTYEKNENLHEVAAMCPDELYFLETDAPFLTPQKYRGERNEPAYVVEVAKMMAELRGQSLDQVEWQTTKNAESFFGLPRIEG